MDSSDIHFMGLALKEARKGLGRTSPNPCVGAVVVKDGVVVGKGYHHKAGELHAEPNALRDAGGRGLGATLYVTLEPCNHTGRTPPCTEAIRRAGIARVVIGMTDPNPLVTGGGVHFLQSHGIAVTAGILEEECRDINRPFIKYITTGQPWVIMKAGMSLDGRIAAAPNRRTMITGDQSRRMVHKLREQTDAILIGVETALVDNPLLAARTGKGGSGKDPERIVLDTHLRLSPNAKMLRQESSASTWIFCGPAGDVNRERELLNAGAKVIRVPLEEENSLDLMEVLAELGKKQMTSVLVEGGGRVHGAFLKRNLVDEVCLFIAPLFLGSAGVAVVDADGLCFEAENIRLIGMRTRRLGDDIMVQGLLRS